jgi:pimeloyl-ACP methyl ester carboxylesterase
MRKRIRVRALGAAVALLCWTSWAGCSEICGAETGRRLSHAGHEIYYEVHGQGPRTLVFIHGWTGSLDAWKYQLGAFPEYRRVAIDLPGNGRSSRREDVAYTMELFADAVRAVLATERIEKAFLFGHSMGFAVVEVVASKYPEMCLGIAAIDGAHFEVPADPAGREQWLKETEAMAAGMTSESAREGFIQMLFLPDTPAILKNEVLEASRTVPLVIGRAMIAGVATDLKYWLPRKSEIPCLAVYSPAYQLPPTYRGDFARTYPRLEYHEVQNVSHYFMLEIPYRLNQIIGDFVARH